MSLKVSVTRHFHNKLLGGIRVKKPFNQFDVRVENEAGKMERVGYVTTAPGATVAFIRNYPDEFCEEVTALVGPLVAEALGQAVTDEAAPTAKKRRYAKPPASKQTDDDE